MFRIVNSMAAAMLVALIASSAGAQNNSEAGEAHRADLSLELSEYIDLISEDTRTGFDVAQADSGDEVIEFDFQERPKNTGDLFDQPVFNEFVSLDFKNADIQNVIRLIAARTGLNILLDPDEVSGNITLHLDNVRLGHALDNILKVNKLAYIIEAGDIVRVVPESKVGRMEVETHTEIITLNWRNAIDVQRTFEPFLTVHGSMNSNEEAQALIITDVPPNIAKLKDLIAQIDKPDRQVVIEARLVDIQIGAARTFQTDISASKANKNRLTSSTTSTSIDEDGLSEILTTITGIASPVAPIGGVLPITSEGVSVKGGLGTLQFGSTIGIFGDVYNIDAKLTALEERNIVEILASPRVTTLNNVPASIQIIERIPYVEAVLGAGGAGTITNEIEFDQAGVTIDVKPIITPSGYVRLDMDLNQRIFRGRVGGRALDPPLIDVRSAHSTVIVQNKHTVVLGGLRGQRKNDSVSAVPWLHRIPVFGWMFKDKRTAHSRTELVLMVTPTIVEEALLTDREKYLYDRIDTDWHKPDYFYDDTKAEGDRPTI